VTVPKIAAVSRVWAHALAAKAISNRREYTRIGAPSSKLSSNEPEFHPWIPRQVQYTPHPHRWQAPRSAVEARGSILGRVTDPSGVVVVGPIKRLPSVRGATRSVTIRLAVGDVETAQELAEKRGIPYQTYIKALLHQALEKERVAG
ncbi:MAG: hypothetical protein AAB225_22255, partial [Acidobacteriota bacterium]